MNTDQYRYYLGKLNAAKEALEDEFYHLSRKIYCELADISWRHDCELVLAENQKPLPCMMRAS